MPASERLRIAPEPQIWSSVIRGLELPLLEQRLDPESLLRTAGIARADLDKPQGSIPLKKYLLFLESAASAGEDPLLGLRMARSTGPETLGAIGFLFLSSRSLSEALGNLCTYVNLLQDATHVQLLTNASDITFSYQLAAGGDHECRQDVEFSLGLLCRLIRIYAGRSLEFTAVAFRHSPVAAKSEYARLLGAPVFFEQESNSIVLPAKAGQIKGTVLDHSLSRILQDFLDERLERRMRLHTLSDRIRDLLYSGEVDLPATVKKIAAHFGVSEATLHRRLKAEGTSLGVVVAGHNFEVAKEYLVESKLSITEIAQIVGFAESASFTRAFRRWADGVTPSQFRKRAIKRRFRKSARK